MEPWELHKGFVICQLTTQGQSEKGVIFFKATNSPSLFYTHTPHIGLHTRTHTQTHHSPHIHTPAMPSPSDSSSVVSASGSRGWSDSCRGMSGRQGGAKLLLYLGLCHLGLGAMVLAFSFTSMAFTSSARVRQSCPFWAGFFVSILWEHL